MSRPRLVVHAHFYQPFRTDPFTGLVPPDPSAAPFRDWNARVTEECYRPNAALGTPRYASWNLGPTLTAYLADAAPEVLAGFADAERTGGGAGLAQSFHHSILPLLPAHDRRTEILWGLRDFEHRFGRPARGMWLPETAADLATLRALADAGVGATILAPWQAEAAHLDNRHPYRVDTGAGRHVAVAFYDSELSGAVSFDPGVTDDADRFAHERIVHRLAGTLPDGGAPSLVIASDGELYGHHQSFRDLFLRRLVAPSEEAPDRGYDVVTLAALVDDASRDPHPEIRVRDRTSWSCHHGILRWSAECPCARDGRWKGPLRDALTRLAGGIDTVTEALARELPGLDDVWAARDGYVDVVIGARTGECLRGGAPGGSVVACGPGATAGPDGGAALAAGDVRVVRLVLGGADARGDAPGAAGRGAGGPAGRRARGHGPRGAAGHRPRDVRVTARADRRRDDLPPGAQRGRAAGSGRGLRGRRGVAGRRGARRRVGDRRRLRRRRGAEPAVRSAPSRGAAAGPRPAAGDEPRRGSRCTGVGRSPRCSPPGHVGATRRRPATARAGDWQTSVPTAYHAGIRRNLALICPHEEHLGPGPDVRARCAREWRWAAPGVRRRSTSCVRQVGLAQWRVSGAPRTTMAPEPCRVPTTRAIGRNRRSRNLGSRNPGIERPPGRTGGRRRSRRRRIGGASAASR